MLLVDLDGAWPKWVEKAGKAVSAFANSDFGKAAITTTVVLAATAMTVATFGTGAGLAVAAVATIGGTVGAIDSSIKGENIIDGFSRGAITGTVGAVSAVVNPTGAALGTLCQLSTDVFRGQWSSPEAYAGAMFGGAIGMEVGNAFVGGAVATGTGELLEKAHGVRARSLRTIITDTLMAGLISQGMHWISSLVLPYDLEFFVGIKVSDSTLNTIESILSGIGIGEYGELTDKCDVE